MPRRRLLLSSLFLPSLLIVLGRLPLPIRLSPLVRPSLRRVLRRRFRLSPVPLLTRLLWLTRLPLLLLLTRLILMHWLPSRLIEHRLGGCGHGRDVVEVVMSGALVLSGGCVRGRCPGSAACPTGRRSTG